MRQERLTAIREDLVEVSSLSELKAMWCHWQAEAPECANDAECNLMVKSTLCRLKLFVEQEKEIQMTEVPSEQRLRELMDELQRIKAAHSPKPPVIKVGRKYRLLKTDVAWSTKPQVQAIMHIVSAHAKPGDVLDESDIVRMMVENETILQTRQGGKRIWDYYKGTHNEGLVAHGNFERI